MVARAPIAVTVRPSDSKINCSHVELEVFIWREDAERFIEGVRGSV